MTEKERNKNFNKNMFAAQKNKIKTKSNVVEESEIRQIINY